MRFTQYLVEEQNQVFEELQQAAARVAKYCQPYLKELNWDIETALELRRGMKGQDQTFFVNNTHTNRKPTDTPQVVHDFIDQWFEQNFGCKFRSTGMFATGEQSSASYYGFPYKVFPIGRFKYVWSPNVKDLYGRLQNRISSKLQHSMNRIDNQEQLYYDQQDVIEEVLHEVDYRDHSLDQAIESHAEIMFCVDQYFALKLNNKREHLFFQQQLQKQLQ